MLIAYRSLFFALISFSFFACSSGEVYEEDAAIIEYEDAGVLDDRGYDSKDIIPAIDPSVEKGDPAILLIKGTIVTPNRVIASGDVLVEDGIIICVDTDCSANPLSITATIIHTEGIIFPGLVDAHNHTQYNYLPKWDHQDLYANHNQWQADSAYDAFISDHRTLDDTLMCEMIKYGEIRSLIAGTTMIQGTPYRRCANTLIRNADLPYHDLGDDTVRTNVLGVSVIDEEDATKLKNGFSSGDVKAYMLHLSEGVDEKARAEFDALESFGLLLPQVVIIHGTALGDTELAKVATAKMPMIWSPSSNLDLYGQTNDISAYKMMGISISLSADWTPSGEANLLDEMRFVSVFNRDVLGGLFSEQEIVEMVTLKPAQAMGFSDQVGSIEVGKRADLLVLNGDRNSPYRALTQARLSHIRLVFVGGKALYGEVELMSDLKPNDYCETITICGTSKLICIKESEDDADLLNQSLGDIQTLLEQGYSNVLPLVTQCP